MNLVLYAIAVVSPVAAVVTARRLLRLWDERQERARAHPLPAPPLERLVADLRRLDREYARIRASDLPHRAVRLQGVGLAYDDKLRSVCRVLDIPVPARPLDSADRLQLEAALAQAGVVW